MYTGYQDIKDIRGIINRYQKKIDYISTKYLTDISRILKSICRIYLNISHIYQGTGSQSNELENR